MVELHIEYVPVINYVLIHNHFDICQSVEIDNDSDDELHNIAIECSGDFFSSTHTEPTAAIKPRTRLRLPKIDIKPDIAQVASITERTQTTFHIAVTATTDGAEPTCLFAHDYPIDILTFDQWGGTAIFPQSLASFVVPNHPSLNDLTIKAAKILKELTGSSAFTAYQTGSTKAVREQVAAVFGALHAENIVYRALPASFEATGQRITLPDQVLATKMGNCIELSLLMASVLENIGINSTLILQHGHAFLAVWLVDDCCTYSIGDDPSYIEKKCAEGIDEMLVIECTSTTNEKASFETAQQIANNNLADHSKFLMFIDFRRCRLEQIRPLPQRVENNGTWSLNIDGVSHDSCDLEVKTHSRYDLSQINESKKELTKMDIWERKLLDFSLRNSMLNLYLRQKAIQLVTFDPHIIEDYLNDGEEYKITFKPKTDLKLPENERLVRSKTQNELHDLVIDDIHHHILHSYQTETDTRNTLKNIYRSGRNAIEETGANALYLAIGVLRWYESDISEKPHFAPILMIPVEMVYKKGDYYIRTRDEETVLNITLIEFLRQNYDIDIPGLSPLPLDEHGIDVSKVFAIIREVLKNQKRWDIEEEAILGIFSFSKYLMWNDVHNHRSELMQNDIVASLVAQKLTFTPTPVESDLKECDKQLAPNDLSLPVAADSSQMAAVIAGGKGQSFILYGPPGTGKSQTITNLIANALFQGKRVLFVAEKMAALSVVQNRLQKIGLAPFCLEMHSNKITKRHVLDQFKMALDVTHIVKPQEYERTAEQLFAQRKHLIDYMEALHDAKGHDGLSVYDCIVKYESIDADVLDIDTSDTELRNSFCADQLDTYTRLLGQRYNVIVKLLGQPSRHPLCGLMLSEADLSNPADLPRQWQEAIGTLRSISENREQLKNTQSLKNELERESSPAAFNTDATALHQEWRAIRTKWFLPRMVAKKQYLTKLHQYNPLIAEEEIEPFLTKLIDYQTQHKTIAHTHEVIAHYFGQHFAPDTLPSEQEIALYVEKLETWTRHADQTHDWYQWCAYKSELVEAGLAVIAKKIESSEIAADTLCDSFLKAMFKQLAKEKIAQSPILRTFEGSIFDESVSHYQKLTEDFQLLCQKELYARLAARVPRVSDDISNSSEIGLLNRNISNGGRGLSLRDLFDQIPTLLPRLCPCMLMSPMSVAQYLDLKQDKFDLVVFDEASQMPTSEAVGAIARGKAVIVVGDPKQMPPTSFFNSTSISDDEADLDDMESILEDCRTLDIPSLQLNWHYRSRHESLIAFSNNEYYDGTLITFPSADDQSTKVQYHFVEGTYDKGGQRSNRKEAEAIVDAIVQRLTQKPASNDSIGVIAFSVAQQNLIEDLLLERIEKDPTLRQASDDLYEPIFVKNLENVQGDERDVIMFSIGYGPDKEGNVSMNFGPLNNNGGERRLNVAVSRARKEMLVFSALKSSQIDLRRSKARGVEGLKHFLEYAEKQILVQSAQSIDSASDSIIAEQIALALRQKGYTAHTNIGKSSFKIDVAVSTDADTPYTLGLLLDGEGYHNTQTTRDREIVQPSVLHSLNWTLMRVWSIDWLNNPGRVIARIEALLNNHTPSPDTSPEQHQAFDISHETVETISTHETDYCEYQKDDTSDHLNDNQLAMEILQCEQPMTLGYLCRRVCVIKEMSRVTSSLQSSIFELSQSSMYTQIIGSNTTVWTDANAVKKFSGYRKNHGRDITEMPFVEIIYAMTEALEEQLSIDRDALTLIAARKLGFTRRGAKVEQILNEVLELMIDKQKVAVNDGKIALVNP